jgi:hypothetical protein
VLLTWDKARESILVLRSDSARAAFSSSIIFRLQRISRIENRSQISPASVY